MRYTYTAVGPVDVEEREGEESLVAFFGEELLFELDKIGFEVNHFWCAAVSPAQKRQERFQQIWPCSNWKDTCYFVSCSFTLRYYNKVKLYNNLDTDTTILNSKCSFQHGNRNILTRSSRIYKTKWNLVSRLPVVSFPHHLYFCTAKKSRHCSPPPFHWLPGKLLGQWGVQRCEQALVSGTWNKRVAISELDVILLNPGIWTTSTTNLISKFKKFSSVCSVLKTAQRGTPSMLRPWHMTRTAHHSPAPTSTETYFNN